MTVSFFTSDTKDESPVFLDDLVVHIPLDEVKNKRRSLKTVRLSLGTPRSILAKQEKRDVRMKS